MKRRHNRLSNLPKVAQPGWKWGNSSIQSQTFNHQTMHFKYINVCMYLFFNFLIYLLIMLLLLSHFRPFTQLHPAHPFHPTFPPYSSCPWVILISSLASTFPTLFLPSPCLFSTYHLCYLFSVPFPPLSPSQPPIDNPPYNLHFCGSVSVLVVCLVFFCFGFRCGCL